MNDQHHPPEGVAVDRDVGLGCDYQGHEFGSRAYPDSVCVDGYLWDADSCEEPGGPLFSGGDIPCPNCNAAEHADYHSQD